MKRKDGWAALLDQFLAERQYTPFHYGRWDCCLFVCDAIEVMTGTDIATAFRGRYDSRRAARRVAKAAVGRFSVADLAANTMREHGLPEVPWRQARRGDAVLVRRPYGHSLGLISLCGTRVIVTSDQGLWRLPLQQAVRAWQV